MTKTKFCATALLAGGVSLACTNPQPRQGGAAPGMRNHIATKAQDFALLPANVQVDIESQSVFAVEGMKRKVVSNEIPNHLVGTFPNAGNPNTIRAQAGQFEMPVQGAKTGSPQSGQGWIFGVALDLRPKSPPRFVESCV